MTYIETLATFS